MKRERAGGWTDDVLRTAVAASKSVHEVTERLGGSRATVAKQIWKLRLDTSHFERRQHRRRWSDDDLQRAVSSSRSIAEVLRVLGLRAAGGNYEHVARRARALAFDTSHFLGAGWNKGLKHNPRPMVPLSEVLVAGRWTKTHALKKRLFREGLKHPRCELCGWCKRAADGRVPIELDHINGDRDDNRLENLRILCPNCHSLQPTHRGLNQRRRHS